MLNLHPSMIRNLTDEEIERYSYLQQSRPLIDVSSSMRTVMLTRIEDLVQSNQDLEHEVMELEIQVNQARDT